MADGPVTFERPSSQTITGVMVYVVVVPFVTLIISLLVAAGCHVAAEALGLGFDFGAYAMLALLPIVGIGIIWFAVQDFRRRCGIRVALYADRITITARRSTRTIPYDDIRSIRVLPSCFGEACRLETTAGDHVVLPREVVTFRDCSLPIQKLLVEELAARSFGEIGRGRTVTVRNSFVGSLIRIPFGILLTATGVLLCVTIKYLPTGLSAIGTGVRRVRQGWRGLGSQIILSEAGVSTDSRQGWCHEWDLLDDVLIDDGGLIVRFQDGSRVTASIFAENAWVAGVMLRQWLERLQTIDREAA